jgi:hypothetical protein
MKVSMLLGVLSLTFAHVAVAENLNCQLRVERYVHQGENYLFSGSEVLKTSSAPVAGSYEARIKDEVYPVKYQVVFKEHDSISGTLVVDIDQPSSRDESSVSAGAALILQTRDYTAAGYDNYSLTCNAN